MRRKTFLMILTLVATTTLPVMAQDAGSKPNMFPSKETATAALNSGNYVTYEPKYFGLHDKNPVDGKSRVRAELERDACMLMLTTAGKQWVIQPAGTVLRWYTNSDGTLGQPYALDSCGNPVKEVYYPPAPAAAQIQPPSPQPHTPPPPQDQQALRDLQVQVLRLQVQLAERQAPPTAAVASSPPATSTRWRDRHPSAVRFWKGVGIGLAVVGGILILRNNLPHGGGHSGTGPGGNTGGVGPGGSTGGTY